MPTPLAENAEVWIRNLKPVNEKSRTHAAPSSPSLRGLQMIGIATADPVWKAPPPFGLPNCRLPLHATLDNDSGVEMWTSQLGAGLLSISLNCEPAGDGASQDDSFFEALLQLNHALATAHQSVWLRPTNAAEITASGEPGEGRVNDDKTTQHLHQFVRDLLRPLWAESRVLFDQRGLVYSAIEVQRPDDPASDFERELFQKLSHLAQLHPRTHPGEDDVRHALELRINSRHLCAMSLTGAAHASILPVEYPRTKPDTFESDEEIASSSEYDRDRLSRIQRKYFPGFLLAQLQRLCLQRILDESTEVSSLDNDDLRHAEQQHLLEKVLRFGLEGEFVQACWRQTLQTHHELAQRVCEVPEGLKTVRRAMGDFNRMATERAEHRRYEEAEKSERTMHILEVFIVSFYSVELAHILGEAFHFPHTSFLASTLGGVAVLTFWLVALLFTWHPLRRAKIWGTIGSLFVIVALIQFSFLAANKWYASRHANDHP